MQLLGFTLTKQPQPVVKDVDLIAKLATNQKVVAIGEIGLDYHYPNH